MGVTIQVEGLTKRFGSMTAVDGIGFAMEEHEFFSLVGPSGCGKTTTLRCVAGLETADEGRIGIKGTTVYASNERIDVPTHERSIGMVFQNYAVWPHMSVYHNIVYPLRLKNAGKAEQQQRVGHVLEMLGMSDLGERKPSQLSGGQQQRVALGRALVGEPDVLLLDEPLSNLDAKLREHMRVELKRIQHQINVTSVFVTHDQAEALTMSDQIIVMSDGRVEQAGPPEAVYNTPATEFVARFLGAANIVEARVREAGGEAVVLDVDGFGAIAVPAERAQGLHQGVRAKLVVRAEKLKLVATDTPVAEGTVTVPAVVETVDYQGQAARYFVRVGERQLQAVNMIDERPFAEGETVALALRGRDCATLPGDG